jgi:hypothetical protein
MAALSLESPGAFRLVAAAAATVGSLALVALGVQLGTNGLGTDGPDRNPATATASPAAAVVDLARPRATPPALQDALTALVPFAGAGAGPSSGAGSTGALGGSLTAAPSDGGTSTAPAPAPAPSPAPAPTDPVASPVPTPVLPGPGPGPSPTPTPTVPDPVAVLDPLSPLLAPVVGDLGTSSRDATGSAGLLPTLTGLLGL